MNETWHIYKITGNCGRAYVGVTKRGATVRWKQHQRDCASGADTYLYNAMRKYGVDWFSLQVLCECYSAREAKTCERALIASHNTYAHSGRGFNLTYGGDGNWGWKPSAKTKEKIGAKSAERMAKSPEYLKNMIAAQNPHQKRPWNRDRAIAMGHAKKGIKLSEEHIRKVRASSVGRIKTQETRDKLKANRPKGIWKPTKEATEKMKATKAHRGWCKIKYAEALFNRFDFTKQKGLGVLLKSARA